MSRSLQTLAAAELDTLRSFLLARPFTERERAYYALCWLPVTQALVDAVNATITGTRRFQAREGAGGQLYLNLDILSDAVDNGSLSGALPLLEDLPFAYIDPWEWPEATAEAPPLVGGQRPRSWVQPLGAHDAYAVDARVFHRGKVWVNLTPANAFVPGVSGWREWADEGELPAWVQPTGAHDAYPAGAEVSHNGQTWRNTHGNSNVWQPGVFGWEEIL